MLPTFKKFYQVTKFAKISYFPQRNFAFPVNRKTEKIPERHDPLETVEVGKDYQGKERTPQEDYAKSGQQIDKPFTATMAHEKKFEDAGVLGTQEDYKTSKSATGQFGTEPARQERNTDQVLKDNAWSPKKMQAQADYGGSLVENICPTKEKLADRNLNTNQYKTGFPEQRGDHLTEKVSKTTNLNAQKKQADYGGSLVDEPTQKTDQYKSEFHKGTEPSAKKVVNDINSFGKTGRRGFATKKDYENLKDVGKTIKDEVVNTAGVAKDKLKETVTEGFKADAKNKAWDAAKSAASGGWNAETKEKVGEAANAVKNAFKDPSQVVKDTVVDAAKNVTKDKAWDAAKTVKNTVADAAKNVNKEDVYNAAKTAKDTLKEGAQAVKDAATNAARSVDKDTVKEAGKAARDGINKAADAAKETINKAAEDKSIFDKVKDTVSNIFGKK